MLGVVQQPVGQEFGSITRWARSWQGLRCARLLRSIPRWLGVVRHVPASSPLYLCLLPSFVCPRSLLKLMFDVPLAQAFLMEEHETYSIPNSGEEPWAAFPRW